jgi:hypothetical protein
MTRRGFFGMIAGAAAVAGTPRQRLPQPPGIRMRMVSAYDARLGVTVNRLDVFYGAVRKDEFRKRWPDCSVIA